MTLLFNILSTWWGIYLFCILVYCIGSISGSMVLGKLRGIDIRKEGSGNAGATNALRTVGLSFAIGVMLIDVLKGFLPIFFVSQMHSIAYIDQIIVLFAISAVIGHVYPLYYGFRGGKGAGTLVGVILAVSPSSFLYILASWIIILVLTGYVGLSTMIAGMSFVVVLYFSKGIEIFSQSLGLFSIFISLFLIFTHRENIIRMYNGNENQFKKIMLFKSK